jgi:hypothetical protein
MIGIGSLMVRLLGADWHALDLSRRQTGKVKILFLASNPKDTDPLRLDEEIRSIAYRIILANGGVSGWRFLPELFLARHQT